MNLHQRIVSQLQRIAVKVKRVSLEFRLKSLMGRQQQINTLLFEAFTEAEQARKRCNEETLRLSAKRTEIRSKLLRLE